MDNKLKNQISRVVTQWADWVGKELADSQNSHQTIHKIFVMMGRNIEAQISQDIKKMTDHKPACYAGCHWCCFGRVVCTPIEAIALAMHIQHGSQENKGTLVMALEKHIKGIEGKNDPWANGLSCPFLRNKRCAIYDFRPMACRGLMSPDANECKLAARALKKGKKRDVPYYPLFTHFQSAVQSGVMVASRDMGFDWRPTELTQAVWLSLQQDDPVQDWFSGKEFLAPAHVEFDESNLVGEVENDGRRWQK